MTSYTPKLCVFECSTATYVDCVQKDLFGSNLPWPTQVNEGDFCCLYHYELSTLFGLWQATCNGARNLVPRAWGGRFPFQVRVKLVVPAVVEIPKSCIPAELLSAETGKLDNLPDTARGDALLKLITHPHSRPNSI